jgi:hypothetical protein
MVTLDTPVPPAACEAAEHAADGGAGRVDLCDRFDLEKAGLAATAEPLRRDRLALEMAQGSATTVALARSRLGINLALQSRWREAAHELAQCHDGMREHAAHQHPGHWALHLTMLGQIAVEHDEPLVAQRHFVDALPGYASAADAVDAEDPLHAATMALLVGSGWTLPELRALAGQALPFVARLDTQRLSFGVGFVAGLAAALHETQPADAALGTHLLHASGVLLRAFAAAPVACRVDWSLLDGLLRLPLPAAACEQLQQPLQDAAARADLSDTDRYALARLRVVTALATGATAVACSLVAKQIGQPLPRSGDQAAAWLPVVEQLLRSLRRDDGREDEGRFGEAVELWLLCAWPMGDGESLGATLDVHARLALLNGRAVEAAALRRQQLAWSAERHGAQSLQVLGVLAALRSALDVAGNVPFELMAVCRQGLDLAVQHEGDQSAEAWWWRSMQVLAFLDAGETASALKAAWSAAQALPRVDAQASSYIRRVLQMVDKDLQRQGLHGEARWLAATSGCA